MAKKKTKISRNKGKSKDILSKTINNRMKPKIMISKMKPRMISPRMMSSKMMSPRMKPKMMSSKMMSPRMKQKMKRKMTMNTPQKIILKSKNKTRKIMKPKIKRKKIKSGHGFRGGIVYTPNISGENWYGPDPALGPNNQYKKHEHPKKSSINFGTIGAGAVLGLGGLIALSSIINCATPGDSNCDGLNDHDYDQVKDACSPGGNDDPGCANVNLDDGLQQEDITNYIRDSEYESGVRSRDDELASALSGKAAAEEKAAEAEKDEADAKKDKETAEDQVTQLQGQLQTATGDDHFTREEVDARVRKSFNDGVKAERDAVKQDADEEASRLIQ